MSSVIFASVYSYDAWWRTIESFESFCLFKVIWWRHQMKTFSALLAIWAGNSPVPGEFPAQSDTELWCFLRSALNQRLSKQSWGWRFETPSRPLWRHCNEVVSWVVGCLYTSHVGCRFIPPPPPPPPPTPLESTGEEGSILYESVSGNIYCYLYSITGTVLNVSINRSAPGASFQNLLLERGCALKQL